MLAHHESESEARTLSLIIGQVDNSHCHGEQPGSSARRGHHDDQKDSDTVKYGSLALVRSTTDINFENDVVREILL